MEKKKNTQGMEKKYKNKIYQKNYNNFSTRAFQSIVNKINIENLN